MNIMIVYGGKSCEHDISVITACLAKGYFKGDIYSVYFDKDNRCFLVPNDFTPAKHITRKLTTNVSFLFGEGKIALMRGKRVTKTVKIDVAVNCCHGLNGEDGTVAALCNLLNIPFVGSPIVPSAVAMDKTATKRVLQTLDMPVVKGFEVTEKEMDNLPSLAKDCNYPIIVKPSMLGSSIGVEVCKNEEELFGALVRAFEYDDKVLCEEALTDFIELNCSAMRANGVVETSKVDCPVTVNDILTFKDKYVMNSASDEIKPKVNNDVELQVKELTRTIYDKLGFAGVIRVDYLFDNTSKRLFVNEINTIPGSLAYGLWEGKYTLFEFGDALISQARDDYKALSQHTYVFESSVLTSSSVKKK